MQHEPSQTASKIPDAAAAATPSELDSAAALWKRLGPLGWLAVASAVLPALGGFVLLYYMNTFGETLKSYGSNGPLIFAVFFGITAGLALLPTYAQSLAGGWAFGWQIGGAAAVGGLVLGALIGYAIAFRSAGKRVTALIEEQPKWKAVYDALLNSGFVRRLLLVALIRLPPNSPFSMSNLVLAATRIPWFEYIVGTAIGMTPRTLAVAYIGSSLQSLTDKSPQARMLTIAGVVVAVVVVIIVGAIANQAIQRVTATQPPNEASR